MIIDASVAAAWVLNEPRSETARTLLDRDDLNAPSLLLAEVFNVLWSANRAGRIALRDAAEGARVLPDVFNEIHELAPLAPDAFAIASEVDHPVYDCVYIALARRLRAPVLTEDKGLARAARRLGGVEVFTLKDWAAGAGDD